MNESNVGREELYGLFVEVNEGIKRVEKRLENIERKLSNFEYQLMELNDPPRKTQSPT